MRGVLLLVALATLSALATLAAHASGAPADIDKILGALALRKHGHVSFEEEKFLAVLDRPVKSSGELLYDAPDRLEKRTLKPKPESVVLAHGVVTAQRGKHRYVLELRDYPQIVPFIESIRATLAGDRAALERVFALTIEGDLESWTMSLTPHDTKLTQAVKDIRITGSKDVIQRVEISEADGDRDVLTIGADVAE